MEVKLLLDGVPAVFCGYRRGPACGWRGGQGRGYRAACSVWGWLGQKRDRLPELWDRAPLRLEVRGPCSLVRPTLSYSQCPLESVADTPSLEEQRKASLVSPRTGQPTPQHLLATQPPSEPAAPHPMLENQRHTWS